MMTSYSEEFGNFRKAAAGYLEFQKDLSAQQASLAERVKVAPRPTVLGAPTEALTELAKLDKEIATLRRKLRKAKAKSRIIPEVSVASEIASVIADDVAPSVVESVIMSIMESLRDFGEMGSEVATNRSRSVVDDDGVVDDVTVGSLAASEGVDDIADEAAFETLSHRGSIVEEDPSMLWAGMASISMSVESAGMLRSVERQNLDVSPQRALETVIQMESPIEDVFSQIDDEESRPVMDPETIGSPTFPVMVRRRSRRQSMIAPVPFDETSVGSTLDTVSSEAVLPQTPAVVVPASASFALAPPPLDAVEVESDSAGTSVDESSSSHYSASQATPSREYSSGTLSTGRSIPQWRAKFYGDISSNDGTFECSGSDRMFSHARYVTSRPRTAGAIPLDVPRMLWLQRQREIIKSVWEGPPVEEDDEEERHLRQ